MKLRNITSSIIIAILFLVALGLGCQRDSKDPPEEATPEPTPEYTGSMIFSGTWMEIGGTYRLDVSAQEATFLNSLLSKFVQTTGYQNEFLFVDEFGNAFITATETGKTRQIATANWVYLSPNGRKFFYNDPVGGLYQGAVFGSGGLLFAADGAYGSHSPDLTQVAYLGTEGLVLADASGGNLQTIAFPVLQPGETFVIPESGDFFPRWSKDGSLIAASVTIQQPNEFRYNVLIVVEQDGTPIVNINNGTQPAWGPDGRFVYYNSGDQIWRWDLEEETNTLMAGGANTVNFSHQIDDSGKFLAFARTSEDGLSAAIIIDMETMAPFTVVTAASNGVLSLDWEHESYCTEEGNAAPTVEFSILVNGSAADDPVATAGDEVELRLQLDDEDCNLAHGVALWSTDENSWYPLSANLPEGSGCQVTVTDVAVPVLADGAYELSVMVEDVCGARSDASTQSITYQGYTGDDDATDDDATDDDTTDDDTVDDDTTE